MTSHVNNKKSKVIVIDPSAPVRQMLSETMRQVFGYENVSAMASVEDVIEYLQVETTDWILTPLMAEQSANALHLLKVISEFPQLKNTRVSLLIDPSESYVLSAAFELGLLSWHKRPTTKDALKEELTDLQTVIRESGENEPVSAAHYLSKHLFEAKKFEQQTEICKNLLKIFPGNGRVLMQLADGYARTSQIGKAIQVLGQAKLVDPSLSSKVDDLVQKMRSEGDDAATETAGDILSIDNVVVIDSDSVTGQGVSDLLKPLGIKNVIHLEDGEAAWAYLEANPEPQLIIMEWRIPKISGPLLIQRIRSHGYLNVPIVILSSLLKPDDMPLIREMGAAVIVQKPLNQELFVPACIWTIQQDRSPTEHQSLERKIRHLLAAGKINDAEPLISKYLTEMPTPVSKKRLIEAEFAYAKGDYARARDAGVEALKNTGDSVILLNLLGKTFMHLSNYEAAIKCFNKAQNLSPQNIERLCNIAEAYTDLGDSEKAQDAWDDAAALDPDAKALADSQIKGAISAGNTNSAKKMMSELESLDNIVAYMNNKAVAYAKTGDAQAARDLYKKTIDSIPEDRDESKAIVLYNLALAEVRTAASESAISILNDVLQLSQTRVTSKARSLKQRLEKSVKEGAEFKLKSEQAASATTPADTPNEQTSFSSEDDYRRLLASVEARQGDLCCFLLYNPTDKDARAESLLAKAPRFQLRAAIERDESMSAVRLAKESA